MHAGREPSARTFAEGPRRARRAFAALGLITVRLLAGLALLATFLAHDNPADRVFGA